MILWPYVQTNGEDVPQKVFWLAGRGTVANVNLRHDDAEQEKDADIPMNNFFKELSMNSLPRLSWKPEACAHTL